MYFLIVVLSIILICAFMQSKNANDFLDILIALSAIVLLLSLVAGWGIL